ncbi:putative ribonuclease H-like domain-containing protein [Tanacetum coccineum]
MPSKRIAATTTSMTGAKNSVCLVITVLLDKTPLASPNEHQLTFNQYADAQSMFIAIKARFGGNDATKKTQKALLKQQYENFNATSSESLDSIFNRLQKLVSRLAILGVDTPTEDLNVKFLRSLPSEWDTHVVVWMNKPDFETMGLDDLYNNFKIVEQKVKRTVAVNNDDKNLAFLTTSSPSSTNTINTANTGVSTGNTKVNTASTETSTASFSDATVYAFLSTQPQGSQLVHEDLEQIHDDDLEEMDLKWNMALLSMRARKFYQRTGRKIIIDGSSTAGYDKSKVECFNCHKMGHFARECRAPRSKDNRNWNQGSSSKAVRIEDASEKAMCAIDGGGFDWSDMAEDEIQANMALMAFTDSEVSIDKSCSKSCLQNYEALKKQYNDLLVKLDDTAFKAATYKRGLSILEAQVVKYKESEVLFSEEIALLKRSVGHKDYLMGLVKTELEKVKEEKEGVEFKLAKFEKSSKDLDDLLASQVTDKSKKGFGYNAVPSPHPLILNRPTPLDLSYSGLEEFQQPEINWYGPRDSSSKPTTVCDRESNNSKENTDDPLTQQPKSVTETSSVVPTLKVDKKWKEKLFNHANNVRLEEPKKARENTDAPIIEDWVSDDEEEVESTPKVEKKIPTATKKESVKAVEPSKRKVRYAEMYRSQRPRGNQRSWTGQKSDKLGCNFVFHNKACFICGNFDHIQYNCPNAYKHMVPRAVLMRTDLKTVKNANPLSTVKSVNTVRPFNTAKFVNTAKHMSGNIAHLSDFKEFDGGYVTFGGGANGGRITGKGTIKTDKLDFEDVYEGSSDLAIHSTRSRIVSHANLGRMLQYFDYVSLQICLMIAHPQVNTGGRELNTATPEGLMGPTPTTEDTQVEDQEIKLGNISPSNEVFLPLHHTRIPTKIIQLINVIGDCSHLSKHEGMTLLSELGFVDDVFAPVLDRGKRIFLAYASYMGFTVYQMDVKSAFLYGQIEEEVYVCQPPGFEDPDHPDKVYKVVKALYGLHQAPRAWKFNYTDVKSASTPTDLEKPLVKDADADDVDEHLYRSMIGSLMYLTASRPDIMFAVYACARFHPCSPKTPISIAVQKKSLDTSKANISIIQPLEVVQFWEKCGFLACKKLTVVATSTTKVICGLLQVAVGQVLVDPKPIA